MSFYSGTQADDLDDDMDYLFADPNPQRVPSGWFDFLDRAVVVEDPDFVLPWNEED